MVPILYESGETAFTTNGLGRLADCTRCTVTEERNGVYELEFIYPLSGRLYSEILEGRIVACTHDDDGDRQPFIIYRRSAPMDGLVTFNAHHISYRLQNVILDPFTASSVSDALRGIASHSINTNPFTFETDKATAAAFSLEHPASVRSIMGGEEGSILDVYGGEWEFNKFAVKLWANRGRDSGVVIRYGKNLADITQTVDTSGAYDAVVPYWAGEVNGEAVLVTLPERIVSAAGVTTPHPVVLDLSMDFDAQPTEAALRTAAADFLANNRPWAPRENIAVDFVQLWNTTEYAQFANLQKVRLCDVVSVYYPALGVTAAGVKVIKTVYNVLSDKYDEIELGTPQATFADTLTAGIDKQVEQAAASVKGVMDDAIAAATELITGGRGGYVIISRNANGQPEEILIMDQPSLSTATNIIRMNQNGIGFSTDGGQTYSTAWTIDGRFVADFIQSGTLSAITIQGPTLDTFWDLTSGRWQSGGNKTVTAVIGSGTEEQTTKNYEVKTVTAIDDGVMEIDGAVDGGTSQQLAAVGVAAQGMGYTRYTNDLYNPQRSDSFVYAGMDLLGSTVTGYASDTYAAAANVPEATYRPHGVYSPDQIRLGEAEDLNAAASGYVADRNPLILTGGWTNVQDAIIFRRYYHEFNLAISSYDNPIGSTYPRTVDGMTITRTNAGNGLYTYTINGTSPTADTVIDYNMGMPNATAETQCDETVYLVDEGRPYWFISGSEWVELQECSRPESGGDVTLDYSLSYGLADAVTEGPTGDMYNWVRLMVKANAPLPLEFTPKIYDSVYGLYKNFVATPIDLRPAWEYGPGDEVEWNETQTFIGRFYNGRKDLRVTIPLSRPVAASVGSIDFSGYLQIITVGGASITVNATVPNGTISLIRCKQTPAGVDLWLRRSSAWSSGTDNSACVLVFTNWRLAFNYS